MEEPGYFSVGELAHRVGVTVRTIQYYDQEGLLSPSAKGPQNRRLYTEENVKDLYRILTLKYLGLSLAEIKVEMDSFQDKETLHQLADRQMDEVEQSFQMLFKRLTTLRALIDKTMKNSEASIDWEDAAQTIEDCQGESQFFWRLTGIRDDECTEIPAEIDSQRGELVSAWHELIADTIAVISSGEPFDSPKNRDLAQRYLSLDDSQQTLSVDQNFILMENIVPQGHGHGYGSFDSLREKVTAHLEQVVAAYSESP